MKTFPSLLVAAHDQFDFSTRIGLFWAYTQIVDETVDNIYLHSWQHSFINMNRNIYEYSPGYNVSMHYVIFFKHDIISSIRYWYALIMMTFISYYTQMFKSGGWHSFP